MNKYYFLAVKNYFKSYRSIYSSDKKYLYSSVNELIKGISLDTEPPTVDELNECEIFILELDEYYSIKNIEIYNETDWRKKFVNMLAIS